MARTIWIEVRVEEVDSLEPGYVYDPKTSYELVPVEKEIDGSIEFVCRRSQLTSLLNRLDKKSTVSTGTVTSRAIYGEPEEEAGALLRDAAKKLLSGFSAPALDAIVDSIEEAVMPNTVRSRKTGGGGN